MALIISGCIGSGIETAETQAIKKIPPVFPTVAFGSPSATTVRTASSAVTIGLSLSDAKNVTLTSANIGTAVTGGASCTLAVSAVTDFSATLSLSACTGNGTVRVFVKANSLTSTTFTGNLQSGNSSAVTVDNAGPTVSTFTPVSGPVAAVPPSVVVTFSEAVRPADVIAGIFNTSASTCSVDPTPGTPVMSAGDTVATVPLTGASCVNGETAVVSVNMTSVHDVIGNTGVGTTTRTYTFTDGPTVAFGTPSRLRVRSASAASQILATFTNAASAPTINTTNVGLTVTGTAACPTIAGSGVTASSGTINISGCTGNGTVAAHMNAGTLTSPLGFPNVQSADADPITVDNAAPTVASATPVTGSVASIPTSIFYTFNEAVDPVTINDVDFVITGTCSPLPTVGTPVMSVGDTVAEIPLTGGGPCTDGETVIVTYNAANSTDVVGNVGSGTTARTYTFDLVGPAITFGAPSMARVSVASSAVTILASFPDGATTPTLSVANVGRTGTGGATCSTVSGSGASTTAATINLSNCSGNGTVAANIVANTIQDGVGNFNSLSGDSTTFIVDNLGPSIVSVTGVATTSSTVTATFDEAIADMDATKFTISGDCTTDPGFVGGSFNANGANTIFTIDLDGTGTCSPTETLTVSVNGASVTDLVGNTGSGNQPSSHTF